MVWRVMGKDGDSGRDYVVARIPGGSRPLGVRKGRLGLGLVLTASSLPATKSQCHMQFCHSSSFQWPGGVDQQVSTAAELSLITRAPRTAL